MHKVRPLARMLSLTVPLFLLLWLVVGVPTHAQDAALAQEAYVKPPKVITDAVLAIQKPNVALNNLSPDGKKFLLTRGDGLPTVDRMARPSVHLAEMAFDPTANRAHALYVRSYAGYDLFSYADKRKISVEVPPKARV